MSYIKTKLIDVQGPIRDEPEGALDALMASIKTNNLMHAVTVIKNPAVEGRYLLIAGRRRFAAMQRLGRNRIWARIRDVSEIQGKLLTITENFHRLELTTAERDAAIVEYAELLRQLPPEQLVPTPAPRVPDKRKAAVSHARAPAPPPPRSTGAQSAPVGRSEHGHFDGIGAQVARDLGLSTRTVQKAIHRADGLTEEEMEVLIEAGTPAYHIDRLVAVKDPEKRSLVVETIGEGVGFFDAMAGVLGKDFKREDDDLSPNEWLATLPLFKEKVDQKRFRADALLYRRVQRAKLAFAAELGWDKLKEETEGQGLYFRLMKYFLDCHHPRQWIKCSGCKEGIQGGREHGTCRGTGYLMN